MFCPFVQYYMSILLMHFFFSLSEILLHYPSLNRTSYLKYHPPSFYSNQSNEIYISVRPIQPDGTILFSSNENPNNQHKPFIHLFLEAGVVHYMFSCDGQIIGTVDTNVHVTLGNTSEILIRYVIICPQVESITSTITVISGLKPVEHLIHNSFMFFIDSFVSRESLLVQLIFVFKYSKERVACTLSTWEDILIGSPLLNRMKWTNFNNKLT